MLFAAEPARSRRHQGLRLLIGIAGNARQCHMV